MGDRPCRVLPTAAAERDMAALSTDDRRRVRDELAKLARDPLAGKPLQGRYRPARRIDFGLSGGWYRACYIWLAGERACLVFVVAPRGRVYDIVEQRIGALRRQRH
jgi:mRNA-degrading endonuclease RelE of RelBE toxin-antitoxin system